MSKKDKPKSGKKQPGKKTLTGKLDISRSGMGFVIVNGLEKDILVRPSDFGFAFNGDTVVVEVPKFQTSSGNSGRMEGKVVEVIERRKTEFTGTLEVGKNVAFFVPARDESLPDFFIPPDKLNGAENGDRVIVKFVKWDGSGKKPEGEVVGKVDARHEADLAMKEILIDEGFPLTFDEKVLKDAEDLSAEITKKDLKARQDFRDVLTFTIDPVDAKDFDDALSIRKLENGNIEIGIHIADVSHFVTPDSELDKAAYERATSVYLPDRVSPMLPEKISNELCSLRPNEDKFCFSCVVEMNHKYDIKNKWLGRTIINSDKRFTYEDAQEIIETKQGLYAEEILLLDTIAKKYRASRFEKGAINFSSEEFRFVVNDEGMPMGIVVKESKDSHQLIEEFMLLANRIVAETVSKVKVNKEPVPFPYRVHGTPDEEKLAPFVAFARKMGYTFDSSSDEAIAKSFNLLLYAVKGKPEEHVLEQLGIRTMAKAIYSTENEGHYGLGFQHYCHFTSPIRRYPDVLVHRVLQQVLDGDVKTDKKMEQKCVHCSSKERDAMEAERAGNKYMQVVYMEKYLGEEFEAVVNRCIAFRILGRNNFA